MYTSDVKNLHRLLNAIVSLIVASLIASTSNLRPNPDIWLIGEIHGTREIPQYVFDRVELFCGQSNNVVLAMDLPESSQKTLDTIRDPDKSSETITDAISSDEFFSQSPDGRASKAAVKFLTDLHHLSQRKLCKLEILALEPSPILASSTKSMQVSQKIAYILTSRKNASVIIYVGNGMTNDIIAKNSKLLSQPGSTFHLVNVQWDGGSAWNCRESCCGRHSLSPFRSSQRTAELPDELSKNSRIMNQKFDELNYSPPWSRNQTPSKNCDDDTR